MSPVSRLAAGIRAWRCETGDTRALSVARVVLGVLLLGAALRAGSELRQGYFGDVFHWPILPESLVPSKEVYGVLLGAEVVAAVLVLVGLHARPALFTSSLLATYVLLCDRVQFHHNRWALACDALLLSLAPCDRYFASGRRPPDLPRAAGAGRVGPLWAARLAQVQVSIVYLASGGSKLLDPDWRAGRVLATRVALYGGNAVAAGVPQGVVDWIGQPNVAAVLAMLAIGTELFLSVGLWPRRSRAVTLWWGVWFHLTIEGTSQVEGFTWLTLAMYALFATPDVRARRIEYDPTRSTARVVARVAQWLDWLGRFEVTARPGTADGLAVVDRDGTRATKLRALALLARCTPLLFPLWLPVAALARVF